MASQRRAEIFNLAAMGLESSFLNAAAAGSPGELSPLSPPLGLDMPSQDGDVEEAPERAQADQHYGYGYGGPGYGPPPGPMYGGYQQPPGRGNAAQAFGAYGGGPPGHVPPPYGQFGGGQYGGGPGRPAPGGRGDAPQYMGMGVGPHQAWQQQQQQQRPWQQQPVPAPVPVPVGLCACVPVCLCACMPVCLCACGDVSRGQLWSQGRGDSFIPAVGEGPWEVGFLLAGGGGGGIEPPKNRGGYGKRAPLTGPLISDYELWRRTFFGALSIFFSSPNTWKMMTFLKPLDAPKIRKSHFHFFRISGPGQPWGPGVSLGSILGGVN